MRYPKLYCDRLVTLLVGAFVASSLLGAVAKGAEPASVKLVPADAAFYSASTQLREQYDIFIGSRAFAKLREMPIVQMGFGLVQAKWNDSASELAPVKAMLEQSENKQLVELFVDAVSHEVFVYGDEGMGDLLELMHEINRANQLAFRDIDPASPRDPGEQLAKKMAQILSRHLDDASVPDLVIGFRLSDTEPAVAQLARLEQLLGAVLASQPDLKQRLSREQIAGGDYVTLQLDGSLIPWEAFAGGAPFDITEIREKVSKMTAAVSVGLRDQYLLVSIGDNNDHLASLGGSDVLANRKELAPLSEFVQQKICHVSYASAGFIEQANSSDQQLGQLVSVAEGLLPLTELDASLQQQIVSDVRTFVTDVKKVIPEPGAATSFVFRTDRGYEGYSYDWGNNKTIDASQPLSILEHVGGDPILMFAGRGHYSPEQYDTLSRWIGRAIYYGEIIGLQNLGPDERELYQSVRGDLIPLVKQLDQIARDKLVPAFRDGQGALVVDAKITSEQWHVMLPPTEEPLPMLELGLVYGVSDVDLLKEAAAGYFQIAQKVIDTLHNADPTAIPEIKLPAPETREFPAGMVYFYRLPRSVGLDKQIAPNAGLSDDTLVMSLIPKTTVRLLGKTQLDESGLLAKHRGAAGVAVQFSLARLIDAIAPWVDYGVKLSGAEVDESILAQIQTGLEIAKCFRELSAVTYQADGAWVTHFENHLEDLP